MRRSTSPLRMEALEDRSTPAAGLTGVVLQIVGDPGANTIVVSQSGANALVTLNGLNSLFALSDFTSVSILGGTGDNTITYTLEKPVAIQGGDGNDTVTASGIGAVGVSTLDGGDGNDTMTIISLGVVSATGGNGNDTITVTSKSGLTTSGGSGNDSITFSTPGQAVVDGGSEDDIIFNNGVGLATIAGGDGNDSIMGGFGFNTIDGGKGNDTLMGRGAPGDILRGGEGSDNLTATGGITTFYVDLLDSFTARPTDIVIFGEPPVQNVIPVVVVPPPGTGGGSTIVVLNPDGTPKTTFEAFPGYTGVVQVATADVTGDGVPDYIVGTGPGVVSQVRVFDGKTLALIAEFQPFETAFTGGVFVAAGDINRDGFSEIVVTPDQGGGPIVAVYNGKDIGLGRAVELARFFGIQDSNFRGGARAAVGDVNRDGVPDIVVSAGFQGGPRIEVWSGTAVLNGQTGRNDQPLANFFAFEESLRNGAFVAVGDVNGDGFGDLIFGGGPSGGPRVRIADGAKLMMAGDFGTLDDQAFSSLTIGNFFVGDSNSRSGVQVSTANLDGDILADVVARSGDLTPPTVRAYAGATVLGSETPPEWFGVDPLSDVTNGTFVD